MFCLSEPNTISEDPCNECVRTVSRANSCPNNSTFSVDTAYFRCKELHKQASQYSLEEDWNPKGVFDGFSNEINSRQSSCPLNLILLSNNYEKIDNASFSENIQDNGRYVNGVETGNFQIIKNQEMVNRGFEDESKTLLLYPSNVNTPSSNSSSQLCNHCHIQHWKNENLCCCCCCCCCRCCCPQHKYRNNIWQCGHSHCRCKQHCGDFSESTSATSSSFHVTKLKNIPVKKWKRNRFKIHKRWRDYVLRQCKNFKRYRARPHNFKNKKAGNKNRLKNKSCDVKCKDLANLKIVTNCSRSELIKKLKQNKLNYLSDPNIIAEVAKNLPNKEKNQNEEQMEQSASVKITERKTLDWKRKPRKIFFKDCNNGSVAFKYVRSTSQGSNRYSSHNQLRNCFLRPNHHRRRLRNFNCCHACKQRMQCNHLCPKCCNCFCRRYQFEPKYSCKTYRDCHAPYYQQYESHPENNLRHQFQTFNGKERHFQHPHQLQRSQQQSLQQLQQNEERDECSCSQNAAYQSSPANTTTWYQHDQLFLTNNNFVDANQTNNDNAVYELQHPQKFHESELPHKQDDKEKYAKVIYSKDADEQDTFKMQTHHQRHHHHNHHQTSQHHHYHQQNFHQQPHQYQQQQQQQQQLQQQQQQPFLHHLQFCTPQQLFLPSIFNIQLTPDVPKNFESDIAVSKNAANLTMRAAGCCHNEQIFPPQDFFYQEPVSVASWYQSGGVGICGCFSNNLNCQICCDYDGCNFIATTNVDPCTEVNEKFCQPLQQQQQQQQHFYHSFHQFEDECLIKSAYDQQQQHHQHSDIHDLQNVFQQDCYNPHYSHNHYHYQQFMQQQYQQQQALCYQQFHPYANPQQQQPQQQHQFQHLHQQQQQPQEAQPQQPPDEIKSLGFFKSSSPKYTYRDGTRFTTYNNDGEDLDVLSNPVYPIPKDKNICKSEKVSDSENVAGAENTSETERIFWSKNLSGSENVQGPDSCEPDKIDEIDFEVSEVRNKMADCNNSIVILTPGSRSNRNNDARETPGNDVNNDDGGCDDDDGDNDDEEEEEEDVAGAVMETIDTTWNEIFIGLDLTGSVEKL
ncbi:hypothetical protein HELRODRAFT_175381 [Helobdella robusta]|uniref:Uncharacterized protein n=1 Tax=Helobdella robusta TaxID=6412 RepID=T1F980_HELRO|nr:hypothetical protein HELRODRAFT_175381 [Helobdella robusta]ESO00885.1 hypothetical protein HELRODRAFT_175381 [Helobdella robusta]